MIYERSNFSTGDQGGRAYAGNLPPEPVAWRGVFRVGGIAALLVVLVSLADIFIMFIPGTGNVPGTRSIVEWFRLLNENWFLAGRDLGLFNIFTSLCTLLVFFGLAGAHRRVNPVPAVLAFVLVCLGAAVYISNNTFLPMLTLGRQYALVTDPAQKFLLEAAGQTLLAQEDISAGSFMGFFISEVACILMSVVMLRGKIFSRLTAWAGLVGESILLVFNICAAFIPAISAQVMPLGAFGGVISLVWLGTMAARFFRLERYATPAEVS